MTCIGRPYPEIFLDARQLVYVTDQGVPDGGVEDVDEAPIAPPHADSNPAEDEASARQAASRSVERGQGALIRNAASSYEDALRYLESRVGKLNPDQKNDPEVDHVVDRAFSELQRGQWIDKSADRTVVLEDFQTALDDALAAAAYEPEEEGPPPGIEGAAEADEGTPATPPGDDASLASLQSALAAPLPLVELPEQDAAPKRARLSDAKRGELTQDFILRGKKDARGRFIPTDAIKPDAFKAQFGEDLAATDQRGKERLKSAVLAKQHSLNVVLKAAHKPTIKTDGIFGPETYAAILEIDNDTAEKLKGMPAAPSVAPAAVAAAPEPGVERAPAVVPVVPKLSAFPAQKEAPPALLAFDRNKFYQVDSDITDLPEAERSGLKEDDVVYLVETRSDGEMVVERNTGQKVSIHPDYLNQLDPDDDVFHDKEAKDSYIAIRLQKFGGDKEHLPNIQRDDIRKIDDALVCISKDSGDAGAGLTAIIGIDGEVRKVKTADLENASSVEKDRYVIARFNAADEKLRGELGRLMAQDAVSIRAPKTEPALSEGKKQYARTDVPVTTLTVTTKVIFISDKTGREYGSDVNIAAGATVAVLGETADGTRYKIATEQGIVGYIAKDKAGALAAKPLPAPPAEPVAAPVAPPPAPRPPFSGTISV